MVVQSARKTQGSFRESADSAGSSDGNDSADSSSADSESADRHGADQCCFGRQIWRSKQWKHSANWDPPIRPIQMTRCAD